MLARYVFTVLLALALSGQAVSANGEAPIIVGKYVATPADEAENLAQLRRLEEKVNINGFVLVWVVLGADYLNFNVNVDSISTRERELQTRRVHAELDNLLLPLMGTGAIEPYSVDQRRRYATSEMVRVLSADALMSIYKQPSVQQLTEAFD